VVRDLNNDQKPDIMALASEGPFDSLETKLVAYLNDGSGGLDVQNRRILVPHAPEAPPNSQVVAFALATVDSDAEPELIFVLTVLENEQFAGGKVYVANMDLGAQTLDYRVLGDVAADLRATSGDLNGDGVEDLVLAGLKGVHTYAGVPVLR
jgi:hypothetical protein